MRKGIFPGTLLIVFLILNGCTTQQILRRGTVRLLPSLEAAVFGESNLDVARTALESDIVLLDAVLRETSDPRLHLAQARLLCGYAFLFVAPEDSREAVRLYRRAAGEAASAFPGKLAPAAPLSGGPRFFRDWLQRCGAKEQEPLFWYTFARAGIVQQDPSTPEHLLLLPRLEAMMERSVELDAEYFHGLGLLFLGALAAQRPRVLGGDPEKARRLFRRVRELNSGRFLLVDYYEALYYCTATGDRERFGELLKRLETPVSEPEGDLSLFNTWVRTQREYLLHVEESLF